MNTQLVNGEIFIKHSPLQSGKTPLVLLMGYSGSIDSWTDAFLESLCESWPIIAIDTLGTGRSKKQIETERLSYSSTAKDIRTVLNHLGQSSAHILGYSYGGTVAMSCLEFFPAMVDSLVLVATTLGGKQYISPSEDILASLANPSGKSLLEKTASIWKICLGDDRFPAFEKIMLNILERQSDALTPSWVLRQHLENYGSSGDRVGKFS